jgi:hypothetical protein
MTSHNPSTATLEEARHVVELIRERIRHANGEDAADLSYELRTWERIVRERWTCEWVPDELNPGPECPYCAGEMCGRFDGLNCTHDLIDRHGYEQYAAALVEDRRFERYRAERMPEGEARADWGNR